MGGPTKGFDREEFLKKVTPLREQKKTWDKIANQLNTEGYLTPKGEKWSGANAQALFKRSSVKKTKPAKPPTPEISDEQISVSGGSNQDNEEEPKIILSDSKLTDSVEGDEEEEPEIILDSTSTLCVSELPSQVNEISALEEVSGDTLTDSSFQDLFKTINTVSMGGKAAFSKRGASIAVTQKDLFDALMELTLLRKEGKLEFLECPPPVKSVKQPPYPKIPFEKIPTSVSTNKTLIDSGLRKAAKDPDFLLSGHRVGLSGLLSWLIWRYVGSPSVWPPTESESDCL